MKTFIVLLAAVALSQATPEWESFKLAHNKVYSSPVEETTRFAIFQQNLKDIEEHNQKYEAGEVSWKQGVNQFTDMTKEEFLEYLKLSGPLTIPEDAEEFIPDPTVSVPDKINWKAQGKVSGVKNQGACGSCWSFSTTGSIESKLLMQGKSLSLSEQQLVDCTLGKGNNGCNGGSVPVSYDYIKANGLEKESDYPYTAKNGNCHHNAGKSVVHVKSYTQSKGEDQLKNLVGGRGPTSVYIDATPLQHYSSGVLDTACSQNINHAVLAVGYDNQGGKDYWLVKNSWGTGWGEQGYVKMVRGKNLCAIGNWLFMPEI